MLAVKIYGPKTISLEEIPVREPGQGEADGQSDGSWPVRYGL